MMENKNDQQEEQTKRPIVMFFDQNKYDQKKSSYETLQRQLQTVIDAYRDLDIGALEFKDLQKLIDRKWDFVFDVITQKQPVMLTGGLRVTREEAKKISEKPAGYAELESVINLLERLFLERRNNDNDPFTAAGIESFYDLDAEGKLVLKPSVIEDTQRECELPALTEMSESIFHITTGLIKDFKDRKVFNMFIRRFSEPEREIREFMQELIKFDRRKGEFVPNHEFISLFNKEVKYKNSGAKYYE